MKNSKLTRLFVIVGALTFFTTNLWATELGKGLVTENTLAYNTPNQDAMGTAYISEGEELVVVEDIDNYYGILIEDNELVYIEKQYLQIAQVEVATETEHIKEVKKAEPVIQVEKQDVHKGREVVEYAKQFIGVPYRSGGTSLTTGVDCSGFTQQIYAKFGISLQRSSRAQYASNGKNVSRADLLPGDLVFYGVGGTVRHVAIYVGNDQIIHAPVPGKTVCIAPISQRGDDPIIGYKRIV